MDTYASDISPLWDLSQATSFSQLPDDDFLALLQKQFPTNPGVFSADFTMNGVNPQTISRYPLPSLTPPSEDSSPSPPQQNSPEDDHALKRKASNEDLEEGPSQKNQHTLPNGKKSTTKRKSSGGTTNGTGDETRLMKRKEQNRAAQRAFRERKEKHVKDLEDKVAELEAKNDAATSENENLRDLLSRLQNENVLLKESSFTFTVPKSGVSASGSVYRAPSAASASSPPSTAVNPLDWSSLTTFDPGMLTLLDDTPQQTATDGAMQMDFGFGEGPSRVPAKGYTTIASNPMFTSFASVFDSQPAPSAHRSADPSSSSSTSGASPFNFDIASLSAWSTPNPDNGAFDDLFGGFMGGNPIDYNDFNVLMSNSPASSISPVAHHSTLSNSATRSPANSTSSSSSKSSDPLFNTPRESSSSDFDDDEEKCPRTKAELRNRIADSGPSPFASDAPAVRKADSIFGPTIMCEGSAFPQTEQSEKNMEILTAWRTVTSDPKFKVKRFLENCFVTERLTGAQDSDLADLCTEFSAKARCDGQKVVLEPQGVRNIIESLGQKHNRK
ncbi:BZIP family transcriptional factor [Favolaschia claudopus]|uniref:BZIP family transcriptional factor n=1 Tax=Favolaschia claudopus TaxID=2862362 RepID=A0AAW0EJ66_9AGAR